MGSGSCARRLRPTSAEVEELFGGRYDERELTDLESLLTRLGGEDPGTCELPE